MISKNFEKSYLKHPCERPISLASVSLDSLEMWYEVPLSYLSKNLLLAKPPHASASALPHDR